MNQRIINRTGGDPTPELRTPLHQFCVPLSATRRGARLARLLSVERLDAWGIPTDLISQVVAELAANGALHGRVPGRSFRLGLYVYGNGAVPTTVRIEVTDTRGDRPPLAANADGGGTLAESGYGLLLVEELADRWGVLYGPVPVKTVWAECDVRA